MVDEKTLEEDGVKIDENGEEVNPEQTEIAGTEAPVQDLSIDSIISLIDDFVNDRDIVDWDWEFPEEVTEINEIKLKVVFDENGDEVEEMFFLKLVLDETKKQGVRGDGDDD